MALPASFDWQAQGGIEPGLRSGWRGCCWACASCGVAEAMVKIFDQTQMQFSPQWLIDCDPDELGQGCEGGNVALDMFGARADTGNATGAVLLADDPFAAKDLGYGHGEPLARHWACPAWSFLPLETSNTTSIPDEAVIKSWLIANGPVWVAMYAGDNLENYTGGVLTASDGGTAMNPANHAVVICGYDDTTSPPCWKVRNSWGASWGEQGYFRIARTIDNIGYSSAGFTYAGGGIIDAPTTGTIPVVTPTPTLLPTPTRPLSRRREHGPAGRSGLGTGTGSRLPSAQNTARMNNP